MDKKTAQSVPALEVHLFGQFKIFVKGEMLRVNEIKGRKARSLLKLIASRHNSQMVRDHVIDILWPELDADAANSQLYKALHHIRKAFTEHTKKADEWIRITDNLIRISPPGGLVTDVQQFEKMAREGLRDQNITRLENAASTYTGDFLPMDRYAEWASLPREHYRQLYLDVLTALASIYEEENKLSEAAERARHALEIEPTLETAHQGLMRIFARKGQVTRAFHQYDVCREILGEELGMSPSDKTKQILSDIRNGLLTEIPGKQKSSPAGVGISSETPLIGRIEECNVINHCLKGLASGKGGGLIISGEAGIGKTRLIREMIANANKKDIPGFQGQTELNSGNVAYGPFIDLMENVLQKKPGMEQSLPAELGRLIPGFTGENEPAPHADKLAAKGYLFAQVHRFFSVLSKQEPVVIVLEDFHHADRSSRELLSYLVQYSNRLPVLFVITLRKEESEPVPEFISQLQKYDVKELELSPFTYEEHVNLLHLHAANAVIGADTAGYIYQLAEGNPFYAIELMRHYAEEGFPDISSNPENGGIEPASPVSKKIPDTIHHTVQQKLEKLSVSARTLLYIAAVIGRQIPYEVLAAVWTKVENKSEEELFNALEESIRARFLHEHGLDYTFRHALVHETIYTSISAPRRQMLHEHTAEQLLTLASESGELPVEKIARQYLGAGKLLEGAQYLKQAGETAESAYAHDDALEYYFEALEVLERNDNDQAKHLNYELFECIGDVYRACGRLAKCYDAYEKAITIAEEISPENSDLIELHRKMAVTAILQTDIEQSEKHLDKAFELAGDDLTSEARLFVTKALHMWHLNQLDEAYEVAKKALAQAKKADAKAEASQACEILAMTCLPLGRWEEGLKYEMEREIYGWSPDVVVATDAHLCLWEYHVSGDQPFQKAQSFLKQVSEQATRVGDLRCTAVCHYALGTMYLWRGNRRNAVNELSSSLELHEQVGSPAGMAYSLARKSVLHTMMGAGELGWQAVQSGLTHARQAAVRDHCLQRLYGVGIWNRMEAGDFDQAQKLVFESEKLLEQTGACGACALELYPWLVYYYLKTSQPEQARECYKAVSDLAQKTGNPIGKAIATIIESSLCIMDKDPENAENCIRKSREILEQTVPDTGYSPINHYLERMVEQQAELH